MIDITHRPNEPPLVESLVALLEKTDKERIRKNVRGINKDVDYTKAKRSRVKLFH